MQALIKNQIVVGLMDCDTLSEIKKALDITKVDKIVYIGNLDVLVGDAYLNNHFMRDNIEIKDKLSLLKLQALLDDATTLLIEGGML